MFIVNLRFMLLGPFIGGGLFVAVRDLLSGSGSRVVVGIADLTARFFTDVALFSFLGCFIAIPLGLAPGFAAGIFYWHVLNRYTTRNPPAPYRALIGALFGGLCAGAYGGLFFSFESTPVLYTQTQNILAWIIAGAISGGICGIAIGDRAYLLARAH